MSTVARVQKVTKDYRSGPLVVHALRGVSFSIETGSYVVMAGPSGSGKTTLLNIIGALDSPTSGDVFVDGNSLAKMRKSERVALRREKIGFVFQAYNLMPVLTALENTEYIMMLNGIPTRDRRKRAKEILHRVGLDGMEDRFPHQMSGGQQQRVSIARAIVSRPKLILADEPTANLDSETTASLLDLTQELNRDLGMTFLFCTHDPAAVKRAQRVLWLIDGKLDYDGPLSNFKKILI